MEIMNILLVIPDDLDDVKDRIKLTLLEEDIYKYHIRARISKITAYQKN